MIGRICFLFGPLALPSEVDLLSARPHTCIEAGDEFSLLQSLRIADLDGDGIADVIVGSSTGKNIGGAVAVFRGRPAWPPVLRFPDADWISSTTTGSATASSGISTAAPTSFSSPATATDPGTSVWTAWTKTEWDLRVDAPDAVIWDADGATDNPPRRGAPA